MPKYRQVRVDGKGISEHRAVWEQAHGPIPPGGVIHHINGDTLDNRLENLRLFPSNSDHQKYGHRGYAEDPDPRIVGKLLTDLLEAASELEVLEQRRQEVVDQLQTLHHSRGGVLRAAREDAGLKMKDLAASLGTSVSYISQIENGVRGASSTNLMRFYTAISASYGSDWSMTITGQEEHHGFTHSGAEGNAGSSFTTTGQSEGNPSTTIDITPAGVEEEEVNKA